MDAASGQTLYPHGVRKHKAILYKFKFASTMALNIQYKQKKIT